MRPRPRTLRARELVLPVLSAIGGSLLLAWLALKTPAFSDYEHELEPALFALQAGDLDGFADGLPSYGGSVVLRLPFVFLPELWGGGDLALFRSLAVPCLAAAAILGVVLFARAAKLRHSRAARWTALGLCAFNPLTIRALEIGHPEELLGGALCVGAALAAGARRPLLAGVLVGLAIANKPWAALALVPVAAIAPVGRMRLLGAAALAGTLVLVPLTLLGGAAVARAGAAARDAGQIFQPWQLWWFLGDHGQVVTGIYGEKPGYRAAPDWIGQVARPLVVAVPMAIALLAARRRRSWTRHEGLLLLALVLLLRCLLDPWNIVYYELPFLFALVAWEVHARAGVPVVSLTATLLCWVTLEQLTRQASPDVQAIAFLAWTLPLALAMALRLLAPDRWRSLTARLQLGKAPFLAQLLEVRIEGQGSRRA